MEINPIISILMPVYNGEKFLKEAIQSILNQTFTNFEFIIINDGSTDKTEEIILSYNDPRIIYVKNEENIKLIRTLNKGIDLARGEYIARMDADDISFTTRFEKQIDIFDKRNYDVISTSYIKINDCGKKIGIHLGIDAEGLDIAFISFFISPLVHPSVMIKSEVLKKYKYSLNNQSLHMEDYELWSRLIIDKVRILIISDPLIFYRRTSTNITEKFKNESINKHVYFAQKMQSVFLENYIDEKSIKALIPYNQSISNNELKKTIDDAIFLMKLFQHKYKKLNLNVKSWLYYRCLIAIIKSNTNIFYKISLSLLYIYLFPYSIYYFINNIYKNRI